MNILSIPGFGLGILGNTKYMSYPFGIVQGFLKSDFLKDFYNDDLRKQTSSLTMDLKTLKTSHISRESGIEHHPCVSQNS